MKTKNLTRSEQKRYRRFKKILKEIKLYLEGKIQLQDADEFLKEL